ncbi:hypothetical protein CDD82_4993 [Ophiocordyceps australis]|uniref:Bifunctional lycopene cyclase/phytoene synthase n=1 Tax=Ophiocordyceps australis TaxID=1399860 RepID=A0A2C5ZNT8_9HYPO|nr:hypothetical protein CDD82_4993 [Ophiocordyceps australis]
MGLDYWFVHFVWTLPPAAILTVVYWPFMTRLELYKILTLITIAVVATIPWDSYLIRTRVWTYPPDGVVGTTLFSIPIEEVFFFIIQTYTTAMFYTLLTKRLVMTTYLGPHDDSQQPLQSFIAGLVSAIFVAAALGVWIGGRITYLGLILAWVCPVFMLQWMLAGRFLLRLPGKEMMASMVFPSLYLCAVDNRALESGVWAIEAKTKLNIQVFGALEIEEAVFFFVTNMMIVLGMVTMDYTMAIAEYQIARSPDMRGRNPSLLGHIRLALGDWPEDHGLHFLKGLTHAVKVVSGKSQSMYMGSAMFEGGLRIDLLLLYYFCRVSDDLVDEAPSHESAQLAIEQCSRALRKQFSLDEEADGLDSGQDSGQDRQSIPSVLQASVSLLPTSRLRMEPFLSLLAGFKTDLGFKSSFPIETDQDLETYAYNVAGSVAASIVHLVFEHYQWPWSGSRKTDSHSKTQARIITAAENMGQALQYVNIARDIAHDAAIGRVYLPTRWLAEEGLKPADVLASPNSPGVKRLRTRMLDLADAVYVQNVAVIDELPAEVRGPTRTVVESYMMIGTMVRQDAGDGCNGNKLKVSLWRRLRVAWMAMCDMARVEAL